MLIVGKNNYQSKTCVVHLWYVKEQLNVCGNALKCKNLFAVGICNDNLSFKWKGSDAMLLNNTYTYWYRIFGDGFFQVHFNPDKLSPFLFTFIVHKSDLENAGRQKHSQMIAPIPRLLKQNEQRTLMVINLNSFAKA